MRLWAWTALTAVTMAAIVYLGLFSLQACLDQRGLLSCLVDCRP